jgi:hypothetical protein
MMPEHATSLGDTHAGQRQNKGILVAFKVRICIWTILRFSGIAKMKLTMKPRNTQKREKGIEISTQTGKEAKRQRIEPRRH